MSSLILAGRPSSSIQTMTSLEIAEVVKSRHDNVKRAIIRLSTQKEDKDGNVIQAVISEPPMEDGIRSANGTVQKHYLVDKRSSYIIVAQLSPEFTADLVDRWQKLEQELEKHIEVYSYMIEDPADRAIAWAGEYKEKQLIEVERKELFLECAVKSQKIKEDKPKVVLADAVTGSKGSISVAEMAKILHQNGIDIGQQRLFIWLRKEGLLLNNGAFHNTPSQKAMQDKLFELKEHVSYNMFVKTTTRVTGEGQKYLIKKFLDRKL